MGGKLFTIDEVTGRAG